MSRHLRTFLLKWMIRRKRKDGSVSDRETKVQTLSVILEAFNRHDLDAIMDCFADDCVFESPRAATSGWSASLRA